VNWIVFPWRLLNTRGPIAGIIGRHGQFSTCQLIAADTPERETWSCQACLTRDQNNTRTIGECPAEEVPSWCNWESESVRFERKRGGLNRKWPLTWG